MTVSPPRDVAVMVVLQLMFGPASSREPVFPSYWGATTFLFCRTISPAACAGGTEPMQPSSNIHPLSAHVSFPIPRPSVENAVGRNARGF